MDPILQSSSLIIAIDQKEFGGVISDARVEEPLGSNPAPELDSITVGLGIVSGADIREWST